MQSTSSVFILPASTASATTDINNNLNNSISINNNNNNNNNNSNSQNLINNTNSTNNKSTLIILSPSLALPITNLTSFLNTTSLNTQKSANNLIKIRKERPIKPLLPDSNNNVVKKEFIEEPKPIQVKKRASRQPKSNCNLEPKSKKRKKTISETFKAENSVDNSKLEINDTLPKPDSSNNLLVKDLNKTKLSETFFDSIEYLSSNWSNIFKTGNETDPNLLNLFRQFHCADCLKSFQQETDLNSVSDLISLRNKMNTPNPQLHPISPDTIAGLNNYFGQSVNQSPTFRLISPTTSNQNSFSLNDTEYHFDLQEKKTSLSRKLAQRTSRQELVERGIFSLDANKNLDKAQLQDILETKLEKRPNRELLVQKNILPDTKAAPSLQLKCNELKRARLADDLNEKLAKRPGPLELVESGILVSADSSLNEAIKDGKIAYPRTTVCLNRHHPYHHPDYFNIDESNLNFNFNNLTDNDDSNASQNSNSTTQTNNTLASLSSSSVSSFNFFNNNNQQQSSPLQLNLNNEFLNFNNEQSNVSSPASSISIKNVSSPFNIDLTTNIDSPSKQSVKSNQSNQASRKFKTSLSSSSSNASSTSKSNKKVLIFHEYRGPNQKSSKTSIKLNSLSKNSTKAGSVLKSRASSSSLTNDLTLTNQDQEDNSNDSCTQQEELNAYKIRLEQQKMFLQFNNSLYETQSQSHVQEVKIEPKKEIELEPIQIQQQNNQPQQQIQIQQIQQNQPIQLVPIGDVKMLDNLKNLISNGLVPIRTISLINNTDSLNPNPNCTTVTATTSAVNNNSNNNLNNSINTTNQIFSIDSGNLTPVIITTSQAQPSIQTTSAPTLIQPVLEPIKLSENIQQPIQIQVENLHKEDSNNIINTNSNSNQVNAQIELAPLPNNLEELSVNKLREECARRKLSKSGVKQKLIERLKNAIQTQKLESPLIRQQSTVKSPDSGVNMDTSSPSFVSCEPSPCGSSVSTTKLIENKKMIQNCKNEEESKKSSLDEFFELLNVEKLGNNNSNQNTQINELSNKKAEIKNISNQLKMDTFKTSQNEQHDLDEEKDLSQTALTLEMSLKNSAELLKQLSSAGQIENLHKLEKQMQQSMQLIEKLKLASSKQQLKEKIIERENSCSNLNNLNSKLRIVNSMPSNLSNLGQVYNNNNISSIINVNEQIKNIPVIYSNENNNKPVVFTCDSLNEVKTSSNMYSNNSVISSSSSSTSSSSSASTSNQNHIEMDWNDAELFNTLCSDLETENNLINNNNNNNLKQLQDTSQNTVIYLKQDPNNFYINQQNSINNNNQTENRSIFNFELNETSNQHQHQLQLQHQQQYKQNDQLINVTDSTIMLPWEILEPDYNQLLGGYISPTI